MFSTEDLIDNLKDLTFDPRKLEGFDDSWESTGHMCLCGRIMWVQMNRGKSCRDGIDMRSQFGLWGQLGLVARSAWSFISYRALGCAQHHQWSFPYWQQSPYCCLAKGEAWEWAGLKPRVLSTTTIHPTGSLISRSFSVLEMPTVCQTLLVLFLEPSENMQCSCHLPMTSSLSSALFLHKLVY
jgi:hypothetical protein